MNIKNLDNFSKSIKELNNSNKSFYSMSKIKYKLRKFKKTDVESISKYANNKNIAKFLTNEFPHPYSKEDAKSFINIVSKENPTVVFAIEIDGEAVGSIGLTLQNNENNYNENKAKENTNYEENKKKNNQIQDTSINICDKSAELGYWLAEKYWNNGIMTSAIREIIGYGFEKFNIDCIFATPFKSNIVSQKVLQKAGFKTNSKLRRIIKNSETYDVFIFFSKKN